MNWPAILHDVKGQPVWGVYLAEVQTLGAGGQRQEAAGGLKAHYEGQFFTCPVLRDLRESSSLQPLANTTFKGYHQKICRNINATNICILVLLLRRTEGQGLEDPGGHGVDERHSVGHHVVPLWVVPGGFPARLPVRHRLVAPDVVDGV